jgi:hypothetical protein
MIGRYMLEKGSSPAYQSPQRSAGGTLRPGRVEALTAAALFALLALAIYGFHVAHGGFYADDWANVATFRFADSPRYWSSVEHFHDVLGGRPLLSLMMPLPQALFGSDAAAHLALAAGLGAVASACFYGLLRTLGMAPIDAAAIAALALLFPWSDSIRLWPSGSLIGISVCFFLLGLIVALRGLARRGWQGVAIHAAADVLFALSVLTYEDAAAAALIAGALYLGRAPRRTVFKRWLADVAVVLAVLAYSLAATAGSRPVGSPLDRLGDVPSFLREGSLLLVSALEPFGSLGRPVQALALLVVAVVIVASLLRLRRRRDESLRVWLRWLAIGLVGIAAAYFMFLGSNLAPGDPGIDNRINVFAGFAFCLSAYALIACGCRLAFKSVRIAAAAPVAVAVVIAIGYLIRVADDQSAWDDAARRQQVVIDRAAAIQLSSGSTVLTFGVPAQAAAGVPIFSKGWDLRSALQVELDEPGLHAYPVYDGVSLVCGSKGLQVAGAGDYGSRRVAYGPLYFLDVPGAKEERIAGRAACTRALRRFEPGPLEL